MKTKITLKIMLLLMVALTNIQCSKTPPDTNKQNNITCDSANTVLIPADMKARFYFKEGTYWIYKNIDNGEIDSMWVSKSGNDINPTNPKISQTGLNKCYEGFGLFVKNNEFINSDQYFYTLSIESYPKDGLNLNNELYNLVEVSARNNYLGNVLLNNKGGIYEKYDSDIHFIDTITIQTKLYTNVLNLNYPNSTSHGLFSDAYYVKNIGLVKFVRSNDNSIWELIRYKINQ